MFKRLYITKCDTYDEVHLRICGAYNIANYTFLECIKGGNKLAVSSNQKMNGQDLIVRRGWLYLCKDVDKVCTFVTDLVNIYRDCMYLFVKYFTHYNMQLELCNIRILFTKQLLPASMKLSHIVVSAPHDYDM